MVTKTTTIATRCLLTLVGVLFVGYVTVATPQRDSLDAVINALKQQFAPDERTSVFNIKIKTDEQLLIVTGEVNNAAVKSILLDTLQKITQQKILDNVTVLPSPMLGNERFGIVRVSVADLRKEPDNRKEMVTQALMGTVVHILKEGKLFWLVRLPDGYLGWMKRSSFTRCTKKDIDEWEQSRRLIVTTYFEIVRSSPSDSVVPVSDVVMGCIVLMKRELNDWIEVELPDKRNGYLKKLAVQEYDSWKASRLCTPSSIEQTAESFLGFPYIWGGASVKGFDCSGFIQTVFRFNGIELLRDADMQATMGNNVEPGKRYEHLRKGDLLFFGEKATKKRQEKITHVALYIDTLTFIHCAGNVHYSSFNPSSPYYDPSLTKSFLRARRILQ